MTTPKKRKKLGKRLLREDCIANDCHEVDCDVCHIHDEPADVNTGLCETCEVKP